MPPTNSIIRTGNAHITDLNIGASADSGSGAILIDPRHRSEIYREEADGCGGFNGIHGTGVGAHSPSISLPLADTRCFAES
jgi:hypothetical protein